MTDLSDFNAGVDHDPGPEDEVRLMLSKWIRSDSVDVYWAEDHDYGWDTFDPGQRARPDLLIDGPDKTYAVEVKTGEEASEIHDALPQLVDYWKQVVNGDTEYKIDSGPISIDAFLLATKHSPHGRVYDGEGESDVIRTGVSEGRQKAVSAGQLPKREFNASERVLRTTWRFSKREKPDAEVGIGFLLSSRLDGDDPGPMNAKPAALYKSHRGQPNGNSNTRYQWWEYIPFFEK